MAKDLRTFLDQIQKLDGEFVSIDRGINPGSGEVTALMKHLEDSKRYPATLFRSPGDLKSQPSMFELLSNTFATREKCAVAMDVDPSTPNWELSCAFGERARKKIAPQVIASKDAPVHQNIWKGRDADVGRLPIVHHFEMDHGPTLTMAHVMKAPGAEFYDISFAKTFYKWDPHHMVVSLHTRDLARMVREYEARNEPAPIINVLGHHPAFYLGSLARNKWGDNDYETLGSFLNEPLRVTPSVTWGDKFMVPADAEIIIEGEIPPGQKDICDPFGEVGRLYQAQCLRPVFEVKAITYRRKAIMQDIFSGFSDSFPLGALVKEATIYDAIKPHEKGVTELHCPDSGCGVYTMYVSVKDAEPGDAAEIARITFDTFGVVQMCVVVDDDIDVFNEQDVLWAVHTYADLRTGLRTLGNWNSDTRPEIAGAPNSGFGTTNWGGKLFIDATKPKNFAFGQRSDVAPEIMKRIKLNDYLPGL